MKKPIYILFALLMSFSVIHAQDAHYSQFENAPMFLNPAHTGNIPTKNRLGINYRTQWAGIPEPYTTYGVFFDKRTKNIAWGILLNQNDAGVASLKQTNAYLNLAVHQKLGSGNNKISLGGQVGFTQKKFDPTALTFDNQYTGIGFDANASNGENFSKTSILSPDFNVGFLFSFAQRNEGRISGDIGLSVAHLNTPNIAFYEGEEEDLPMKRLAHIGINYKVNNKLTIRPRVLWMSHYTANELTFGVQGRYRLLSKNYLTFGADVRTNDAFVLKGGVDLGNLTLAASYDVNTSTLQPTTNGNGAFEIAAIWHFNDFKIGLPKLGPITSNEKDTDGDGIIDRKDDCPTIPGLRKLKGCPETGGGIKDTDGDGVIDSKDNCPTVPGLIKYSGCPDEPKIDSDGDGILDQDDLCPTEPGLPEYRGCNDRDKDGVMDNNDVCPRVYGDPSNFGCPLNNRNLDSDGDGILDKDDKCVYLKGLAALNGCPDSDKDGISNIDDECPFIKGSAMNKGCPLPNAPQTPRLPNAPIPTEQIGIEVVEFDTDKAIIKPYYFPRIDKAIGILMQNPNYNIILQGHTDSEGSAAYNYQLGQRRSQAVRAYMMQRGVAPNRIQILSYGENIPKQENQTNDGKARNRRTELIVLDNYNMQKYNSRN